MRPLLVVDSFGVIFRAYYAQYTRPLTNPSGRNISAWFGFFKAIFSAVQEHRPQGVLFALESETPTWRVQTYEKYKQNRQETPQDLADQIPLILDSLEALGWPILKHEGYEADDCIASLAKLCRQSGTNLYILSGDKDLMQLVDDQIKMLKPGKAGLELLDAEGVYREKGVWPNQIVDYLSMVGDASDNLPGVKGVGEKTAQELIRQYASWDAIFQHLDELKPGVKKNLEAGKESGELTRRLVSLHDDLELGLDLEKIDLRVSNPRRLLELFREQNAKTLAADFQRLLDELSSNSLFSESTSSTETLPPPAEVQGNYRCLTDPEQLCDLLEQAAKVGVVSLDTETTGLDPQRSEWLGFSFCFRSGEAFWVPKDQFDLELLKKILADFFASTGLKVVAHNWNFDWRVFHNLGLRPPPVWFDTMTAAWLLDVNRNGYNLEDLALQYLRLSAPDYKSLVPKGKTLKDVGTEELTRYASKDADLTLRLYECFYPKLREQGLDKLYFDLEIPVQNLLCRMEGRGIQLDSEVLRQLSLRFETAIRDLEQEAFRLAGHEFNLASTKQLQEVLFEERKLNPGRKTKTGLSTDSETLEELAAFDPLPEVILRYRQFSKLKSTYVDTLPDLVDPRTGRVHTSFYITGTATGRLSSKDPNLQNIPIRDEEGRAIRSAFRAAEGYTLISADYSQIELVVLAHFSEDPILVEAFQQGQDIHRRTAALVFNVPEDQVSPSQRRAAKAVNFGIIYGMSAFRLARELGIPRTEAASIIEQYFNRLSRVKTWIQETIGTTASRGYVQTLFGRRRPVPLIKSQNQTERQAGERMAVNSVIQGSAADIMKKAMLDVDRTLSQRHPEAALLLQVHDELLLECPLDQAEAVSESVKKAMERSVELKLPLRVSVECAVRWGELH